MARKRTGTIAPSRNGRFNARVTMPDGSRPSVGTFDTKEAAEVAVKAALRNPWKGSERVYFVRRADGMVKIGRTKDVDRRMNEIRVACPEAVLLATCVGDRALEYRLHQRFHDAHSAGEWFHPTADVLAEVRRHIRKRQANLSSDDRSTLAAAYRAIADSLERDQ